MPKDLDPTGNKLIDHLRFHRESLHLHSAFGNDWFALRAESFARFFGTPKFLIGQTVIVAIWILCNSMGLVKFDLYPFILLNLAFSLQAAYAAPLILLAQTRQADRDKIYVEADAKHREDISTQSAKREIEIHKQTQPLVKMLRQNTELTENVKTLTEKVAQLTFDVHSQLVKRA